jgi:hypothetical protein
MIIHLNGWPGVGKETVGRALGRLMRARVIHSHIMHDVAITCTGLGAPDRWALYDAVRSAAYAALARRPKAEVFIMTNALCRDTAREVEAWGHVVDLATARGVPLIPVVLQADIAENARRIQGADRIGRKMTSADDLRNMIPTDSIQLPAVPELLVLDSTRLSAEETAQAVLHHVRALGEPPAATDQHRVLR